MNSNPLLSFLNKASITVEESGHCVMPDPKGRALERYIKIDNGILPYSYNFITCFEKPLIYALSIFGRQYATAFTLYLKLAQAYSLEGGVEDNLILHEFGGLIRSIIERRLHLDLTTQFPTVADLCQHVESVLATGMPVMVTVNLRDLYYFPGFLQERWPYLLLVNGYDRKRKIFHILDATQALGLPSESAGARYEPFALTYLQLRALYASYSNHVGSAYVASLRKGRRTSGLRGLFGAFLRYYTQHADRAAYKEIRFIQALRAGQSQTRGKRMGDLFPRFNDIEFAFARVVSYKQLFWELLAGCLKETNYESTATEKCFDLGKKLAVLWRRILNLSLLGLHLGRPSDTADLIAAAGRIEQELASLTKSMCRRRSPLSRGEILCSAMANTADTSYTR